MANKRCSSKTIFLTTLIFGIFIFGAYNAEAKSEIVPITTSVVLQSSEGLTEEGLNMGVLAAFESWVEKRTIINMEKSYAQNGVSAEVPYLEIKTESHYLTYFGKKLGVIDVLISNTKVDRALITRMIRVFGLVDDGFTIVSCFHQSDKKIPLTFGKCGAKIREIFE